MISGFLLIDKPTGMTSHDVVSRLRKITGVKKIGHAGTLDPNASGLLVVGVGREATKQLGKIAKDTTKKYEAHILLGTESTTDDEEGMKTVINNMKPVESAVKTVLEGFLGEQSQVPPIFSAIKKDGKKAYEFARKGKSITMDPRNIVIHKIELISYSYPDLYISTSVSSGTYIRALARDIGKKLETGAYLKNLKRSEIGKYHLDKAKKLEDLTSSNWQEAVVQLH